MSSRIILLIKDFVQEHLLTCSIIVIGLLSTAIIFYVYMEKVSSPKFETGEIVYPEQYVKTARLSDCTYTNPIKANPVGSALLNGVEIIDSTFCEFTRGLHRDTYLYEIKLFPSETTYYALEEWLYDYKRHVPSPAPTPTFDPNKSI